MSAVFHLFTILEKVVEPELIKTWRMRLLNCCTPAHAVSIKSQAQLRVLCRTFIRDAKECLRRPLFCLFVGEVPNSVFE